MGALRISDAARSQIAIMRARAHISGVSGKKKGHKKKSYGGGKGWFGLPRASAIGNVSLFEAGSVAILGGVTLGSLFSLPAWLSPIGAALWLYGMWRGNAILKSLGLLLVGLGLVTVLGIPAAISAKIQEAKAKGLIPMLGPTTAQAGPATAPSGAGSPAPASSGGGGYSPERIVSVIDNVLNIADRVRLA